MNQNRSNNIFNIKSILHRIFQTPLKFYLRHHLCLRSYFETRPLPNPFYLPYPIKIITEIPNSRSTTVSIFFLQTRPFPNPFDDLFSLELTKHSTFSSLPPQFHYRISHFKKRDRSRSSPNPLRNSIYGTTFTGGWLDADLAGRWSTKVRLVRLFIGTVCGDAWAAIARVLGCFSFVGRPPNGDTLTLFARACTPLVFV